MQYYDKHSLLNTYHGGDLVQIYRLIPPPGMHSEFHHPWSRDPFRVAKVLSPTNYLVRKAKLCTQPITVYHNKIRPCESSSLVGYEDEAFVVAKNRLTAQIYANKESSTGNGAQINEGAAY